VGVPRGEAALDHGLAPVSTKATCRLPHCEQTSLCAQSRTAVSAPWRAALLRRIRFNLMPAIAAPDDHANDLSRIRAASSAGRYTASPSYRRRILAVRRGLQLETRFRPWSSIHRSTYDTK